MRVLFLSLVFLGMGECHVWSVSPNAEPLNLSAEAYPTIICDAGSTGSRIFGYHVANKLVHMELMNRTQVGLSEYARSGEFDKATDSLLPGIFRGLRRLGQKSQIYIMATGGVRQLETHIRDELILRLRQGIELALGDRFSDRIHIRTVEGIDEALFGLLSANYLVGSLSVDDVKSVLKSPIGVLDLGGSSLEVSLAGPDSAIGSEDDVLVSFKSLGTNRVKEALLRNGMFEKCELATVCDKIVKCTHTSIGQR